MVSSLPYTKDFSNHIVSRWQKHNLEAFFVTIIYREPKSMTSLTPESAFAMLKRGMPVIFRFVLGNDWKGNSFGRAVWLYAFLDEPGSRKGGFRETVSLDAVQDSYHHHGILLVKRWVGLKIEDRLYNGAGFSSAQIDVPLSVIVDTPIRHCSIQHIENYDGIDRCVSYAGKRYLKFRKGDCSYEIICPSDYV